MPTPFEMMLKEEGGMKNSDWAARSDKPRRSVFSNFKSEIAEAGELEAPHLVESRRPLIPALSPSDGERENQSQSVDQTDARTHQTLQNSIDLAVARAFLYQFLARAFEDPALETWAWLTNGETQAVVHSAWNVVKRGTRVAPVSNSCENGDRRDACPAFRADGFESFQSAYVTAFGHAARGDCPLNEIEYGDLKADPLFQPHRLADLAAFYRAFGLEVADAAAERPDHIGMELEFMSVLAAKEAYAHEHQWDNDQCALCRDAQKKFLREHLGRWSPAFAWRLARAATDETLAALAEFTRDFIATDCARFGLTVGSEDLLLRPVDEASESMCDSCGLKNLPPGAAAPSATT